MRKISPDGSSKFIFTVPEPYRVWIDEKMVSTGKFISVAAYMRYLLRQDIQRHGPLPEVTPKAPRKRKSAVSAPPARTPLPTSAPAPAPAA